MLRRSYQYMETDMVRGCEKRIYYVKNPESELFDEAYLVLRRGAKTSSVSAREIELEAMRIVRGSDRPSPVNVCRKRDGLRAFLAGALLSAVVIGGLSLLLWAVL